jgi:hypothetical protein
MNVNPMAPLGRSLLAAPSFVADATVERSRGAVLAGARLLDAAKAPTHALAEAGLRVQAVAGKTLLHLVQNNLRVIDGLLDEGVRRLELAAQADNLRTLVSEQIELLADTRERMGEDARRTLALLSDARTQIGAAFASALPVSPEARDEAPRPAQRARTRVQRTRAKKSTPSKRTRKTASKRRRTR